MLFKLLAPGFLLAALIGLAGCENESEKTESAKEAVPDKQAKAMLGPVLATVNEIDITQLDVDLAIERTIGSSSLVQIDDQTRQKVLESLVMSKSLAIKKEQELDEFELASVVREVAAYRDELLAKKYLKENVSATPVSEDMVKDYYEKYPEKFGAKRQKQYQLIQAGTNIAGAERSSVVAALNEAKNKSDWKSLVNSLQSKGLAVEYSQGVMVQGTMAADFERVLKPLKKGETSDVFFMRKRPAIVRVVSVIQEAPKPLSEVRETIRKQLAPVQLKKSIKQSAESVMQEMTINYNSR